MTNHFDLYIVNGAGDGYRRFADSGHSGFEMRIFCQQFIANGCGQGAQHGIAFVFRNILNDVIDSCRINAIFELVRLYQLVVLGFNFDINVEFLPLLTFILLNTMEPIKHHVENSHFCHCGHSYRL